MIGNITDGPSFKEQTRLKSYAESNNLFNIVKEPDVSYSESSLKSESVAPSQKVVPTRPTKKETGIIIGNDDGTPSNQRDIAYYIGKIGAIKTAKREGFSSPHKGIFLLAILRAYDLYQLRNEYVYLNDQIISLYSYYWDMYVPKDCPFVKNISQPFVHLSNDGFYKIKMLDKSVDLDSYWTVELAKKHCEYGILDQEFVRLAMNSKHNQTLAKYIKAHFHFSFMGT
jgi:hypothetical protein